MVAQFGSQRRVDGLLNRPERGDQNKKPGQPTDRKGSIASRSARRKAQLGNVRIRPMLSKYAF